MSRQFSGSEPLVGEIVGLRTFRVDETGLLLPLFNDKAWYDGPNRASCAPPVGRDRAPHPVVAADCECGFYAYGTSQAAARNRQSRHIQAIVSSWGRVVAGTQGLRAEYARIDALWLSDAVPKWVRARVAMKYPSAQIYRDRAAMLAEHPLSELACYAPPAPRVVGRVAVVAVAVAVLALGLLPWSWIDGPVKLAWIGALGWLGLAMLTLAVLPHATGRAASIGLLLFAAAWLVAPAFGLLGWLLRAPVLRAVVVAGGGYLLTLRPGYFPVVPIPRERAFCGVRP
ncbi:MAG TPA: hypothetical protein VIG48_05640 [Jatrophihabitans sp.]